MISRARPAGFEPATSPLVMGALYPLSYGRAAAVVTRRESMDEGSAR